jgi:hypothetical protein
LEPKLRLVKKEALVKIAALFALAAASLALVVALPARSATGMEAMQYYVGTWSCTGGVVGKPPGHATLKYTMNGDVLQTWIQAPKGYVQSSATSYDSKNGHYVGTGVANDSTWFVSYTTISGNTETSVDHANDSGKLGHGVTVRNGSTNFTYTGYPTVSGGKPDFKATCEKS